MKLELKVSGCPRKQELRDYVARRVRFALDRFDRHLRRIVISVTDVNGPRGGRDKRCQMIAEFHQGGEAVVTETRASAIKAVYLALVRLRYKVGSRVRHAFPSRGFNGRKKKAIGWADHRTWQRS